MADSNWRYADARQPALPPPPALPAVKRSRPDYDVLGGHELPGFYPRGEESGGQRLGRDDMSLGASYDRYLPGVRMQQMSSHGAGEPPRHLSPRLPGHPIDDPRMMGFRGIDPGMGEKSLNMGLGGRRSEIPLPPDASNTLFVESLPANCTQREVSHIFRPFVGFREVRLVNKGSKRPGGEPLVLCFVDFTTPAHAAVASEALQGYKFDEHDRDSPILRLQFARFPGPRLGVGPRGKRLFSQA